MNENDGDKKLDWMYKGANSLVDREDYLLGRSVDKALEQLNAEEKEKKLGLVPPKNHVEHECIPPSIRDFNKIVQAEQVDISAKLQEDPLVAIKKREEEARRQFLQNPVQLKKLQEALIAQQLKKKKKHKKSKNSGSDSDLDNKIAKKLKYLKEDALALNTSKKQKKKSKESILDTILMHKFNQLKDKLSQEDLNDILAGNISDSEENVKKKKKHKKRRDSSSEDDSRETKSKKIERRKSTSTSSSEEKPRSRDKIIKKWNHNSRSSSSEHENYNKDKYRGKIDKGSYRKNRDFSQKRSDGSKTLKFSTDYRKTRSRSVEKHRQKYSSTSDEESEKFKDKDTKKYKKQNKSQEGSNKFDPVDNSDRRGSDKKSVDKNKDDPESDLESRILKKLRMLRDSVKLKENESNSDDNESDDKKINKMNVKNKRKSRSSSESSSDVSANAKLHYDSDSDERTHKPKAFGLVKSDGTKILLNKKPYEIKKAESTVKSASVSTSERKHVKKLTEEEKEKLRREMMKNAEKRDKERSDNLRRYREENKKEEREAADFDKGFVHKELLKSTKDATVETRIKSNLNNIQRSSRHMDSNFSRRK